MNRGDKRIVEGRASVVTRWPALDGLRALAVGAVLLCHFRLHGAGGFIGVDVFFVISGFLITSLLIRERDRTGSISLKNFWARRALRLFPALLCAIVLALLVALTSTTTVQHQTEIGIPVVLLYLGNWVRAFGSFSDLGLLGHMWSLAVEEQFYFVWPIVCAVWVLRIRIRNRATAIVAGLAIVDCAYLLLEANRWGFLPVFFRTDTHAMGLLGGSALALYVGREGPVVLTEQMRWRLRTGAALGVAGILFLTVMNPITPTINAAFIIMSSFCAVVVVARLALDPAGLLARVFASGCVRWFGVRSYGIYLYHYPFAIAYVQMGHQRGLGRLVIIVGCLAATLIVAACSYRWIELPFLRWKARFEIDIGTHPQSFRSAVTGA